MQVAFDEVWCLSEISLFCLDSERGLRHHGVEGFLLAVVEFAVAVGGAVILWVFVPDFWALDPATFVGR